MKSQMRKTYGFNDLAQRDVVYRYVVSISIRILPSINFQRALQIIALLGSGPGVSKWECRYTILFPLLKIKCCLSKRIKHGRREKNRLKWCVLIVFPSFIATGGERGLTWGFAKGCPLASGIWQWRHKKLCGASLWVLWVCGMMWEDEGSMPHVTE